MKVLTASQIREADAYTIANEPIASIDLMERAAMQCTNWIVEHIASNKKFSVFCGVGNNGGDGLAIARQLKKRGYSVECYVVHFSSNFSSDFRININRLAEENISVEFIEDADSFPSIQPKTIIIDALFGSGLNRAINGFTGEIVNHINQLPNDIISIDIPSGLFSEDNRSNRLNPIIRATHTLTFEAPKLAQLISENIPYVGKFTILPIGLLKEKINSFDTPHILVDASYVKAIFKPRQKATYKNKHGHALLIGGSETKIGALHMCTHACLRSGAGLTTFHTPSIVKPVIPLHPEAMQLLKVSKDIIRDFSSIGFGPGLDQCEKNEQLLKDILITKTPMIIDADGLNILAINSDLQELLHDQVILTPHPGEFDRIFGPSSSTEERIEKGKKFTQKHTCTIVLKGAISCVITQNAVYFNSTGNQGLAKGGSGDVLTGLITGLKAQGYSCLNAALLGVYIHGSSADLCLNQQSFESMLARDVIEKFGAAFHHLYKD